MRTTPKVRMAHRSQVKSDNKQLHLSFSTNQPTASRKGITLRNSQLEGASIPQAMFACRQLSSNWASAVVEVMVRDMHSLPLLLLPQLLPVFCLFSGSIGG
ncbi:hypothetical protein AVEN_228794-1 [Araneus ventricosus]|uniref:Uncharacterized protein n=1 Tax=Araneus ventricosus TaxID=182803 RepID=A0A4Y2KWA7_ARAVE|nr:hypothetical protein AVEN_228794-1 [Araneus ventricosus]